MTSIHGICYDNGQSGDCNFECEDFINGKCDVKYEMIEEYPYEFLKEYLDPFMLGVLSKVSGKKQQLLIKKLTKELIENEYYYWN